MQLALYLVLLCILYTILWFKGNAKPLFNIELNPWQWWLYTGLITNYLGLISWWFLVDTYKIWGALAITYALHSIIELGLSFYFFDAPTNQQCIGLSLLIIGSFLVLK
tara:strand:- start:133 stop:456 length:324 start_codon:yes stop_codon:yes gene_type:complete